MLAGQVVGIREVADEIWLVSLMNYDLGFIDKETGRSIPDTWVTLYSGHILKRRPLRKNSFYTRLTRHCGVTQQSRTAVLP